MVCILIIGYDTDNHVLVSDPNKALLHWLQGYKTILMLNSAEHEILNAHKY